MTEVLGRPITYPRLSSDEYLERLRAKGIPEDHIDVQKMIYRIVRLNVAALPNRAIRRLTGHPPTAFAEFVDRERAVWMPWAPSQPQLGAPITRCRWPMPGPPYG